MKPRQNSICWLGLSLACGTLAFALTTQAAKPPKPPPPSTSPAYVAMLLGGLRSADGTIDAYAYDLNNAGQVVGRTAIPGYDSGYYSQAFLINPRDVNNDGKPEWFVDVVDNATGAPGSDGQNDLIIPLGSLPAPSADSRHGSAMAVNDLGLVVGASSHYNSETGIGSQEPFIVVPKDTDGDGRADCWCEDADGNGFNDLMVPLGRPADVSASSWPNNLNINEAGQVIGWFDDSSGSVGFLLTPEAVEPGVWQWYRDDGTGANALMVNLGNFIPRGINDSGLIVGSVGAFTGRAILRKVNGTLVDLGAGAAPSWGNVINNIGQIGLTFKKADFLERAGLLTPAGEDWFLDLNGDAVNDLIVDIGSAQNLGGSVIALHGLNDAGSVVGASWNTTGRYIGMTRVAFLMENGVLKTLKSLTGGTTEFRDAYAINNARQIVAEIAGGRDNPGLHACILLPTP